MIVFMFMGLNAVFFLITLFIFTIEHDMFLLDAWVVREGPTVVVRIFFVLLVLE